MSAGVANGDSFYRDISLACDRFEAEWRSGGKPQIELYVAEAPEGARPELIRELLKLDIYYRRERGDTIIEGYYTSRFPEYAGLIERLLRFAPNSNAIRPSRPFEFTLPTGPDLGHHLTGASRTPGSVGPSDVASSVRLFGDYEILKKLGKGGMGIVYLARQRSADRVVALKVIRLDILEHLSPQQRQEWLDRFRAEGRAAARLRHDNIVAVHEVGTIEGTPFYSMAYIEGRSLDVKLRAGPLTNALAAACMEQVARAVQCAHEHHILHRDLKPHNIIVDAKGRPYVADFGLAKWTESTEGPTQTGQMLGSPPYMSPEQATDAANVTESTDVYSLGATLYALVTGRPPFQAATIVETLYQVRHQDPVAPRLLNPAIDRDLETIILQCLRKEAGRRYSSALALADDLRAYCEGRPITARPVRAWERAWMWSRRNKALARAMTAFLLALVCGTIFSAYFGIDSAYQAEKAQKSEASVVAANADLKKVNADLTQSYEDLEGTLARSLLQPLALDETLPLTDVETPALAELATTRSESLGIRFVKEALRDRLTVRQLRIRAGIALHAAVGLDLDKRAAVERVLAERLQDLQGDDEQRARVAQIAAKLGGLTPPVAAHVAQILIQDMAKTTDEEVLRDLAPILISVSHRLDPKDAAKAAALFIQPALSGHGIGDIQAFLGLTERIGPERTVEMVVRAYPLSVMQVGNWDQLVSATLERLEPNQTAQSICDAMAKLAADAPRQLGPNQPAQDLARLTQILCMVARHLEPKDASRLCAQAADTLIKAIPRPRSHENLVLTRGLSALASNMETKDIHRLAKFLLQTIRPPRPPDQPPLPWELRELLKCLSALTQRLDSKDASELWSQAVESLTSPMAHHNRYLGGLGASTWLELDLSALPSHLELKGAVQLYAQAAESLTGAIEYTGSGPDLQKCAESLYEVAQRLEPRAASLLCTRATESLAKRWGHFPLPAEREAKLFQSLPALASRLEPRDAQKACEILIQTVAKATQEGQDVTRLVQWLIAVADRLEPQDAAQLLVRAAEQLAQKLNEKPPSAVGYSSSNHASIARALSLVASRLESKEAGTLCVPAAETLIQAMNKKVADYKPGVGSSSINLSFDLADLANALSLVASRLESKEAARLCVSATEALIQAMNKTTAASRLPTVVCSALARWSESLCSVLAYLEPKEASRLSAQAARIVSQAVIKFDTVRTVDTSAKGLWSVVAFMKSEDSRAIAETLLRAAENPNTRSFLFCDSLSELANHLEPLESHRLMAKAATIAFALLTQEIARASTYYSDREVKLLLNLGTHLEPKEAAEVAAGIRHAMQKEDLQHTMPIPAEVLAALATRLEPRNASLICAEAAELLLRALTEGSHFNVKVPEKSQGLLALSARLEHDEALRVAEKLIWAHAQSPRDPSGFARNQSPANTLALARCLSGVFTEGGNAKLCQRVTTIVSVAALPIATQNLHLPLVLIEPALQPLPCRFSTPELVELLKQPTCVGPVQRAILDQLEAQYGMRFAEVWAFVSYAKGQEPGLDFTSPPKQVHAAAVVQKK
jgi:predicted Ser/Thr protein kinase/cell division protein FtsB